MRAKRNHVLYILGENTIIEIFCKLKNKIFSYFHTYYNNLLYNDNLLE